MPATLADVPKPLREALAAHEFFRRVGYPSDDLYIVYGDKDGGTTVTVQARWGEDKKAHAVIGACGYSAEDFGVMWAFAVDTWHAASMEDAVAMWRSSDMYRNASTAFTELAKRGMIRRTDDG